MKYILSAFLIAGLNLISAAQTQLTPQSIIKDSTGKVYPLLEAFELLKTKEYTIQKVDMKNQDSQEFLLRKKTSPSEMNLALPQEFDGIGDIKDKLKNKAAPEFTVTTYTGKQVDSRILKNKIVVLNFWFTECKPCIKEMLELNDLIKNYTKNEDVVFLAPTYNNKDEVKKFLKSTHFNYQIIPDQTTQMIQDYSVSGYPTHVIIDYNGIVRFATQGYIEGGNAMHNVLKFKIDKLLDEKRQSGQINKIAESFRSSIIQKDYGVIKEHVSRYFAIKQSDGVMAGGNFVDDILAQYFRAKINISKLSMESFHYVATGYKLNFSSVNSKGAAGKFFVLLDQHNKITEMSFLKDEVFPVQLQHNPGSRSNISPTAPTKRVAVLPFTFKQNQIIIKLKLTPDGRWLEFVFDSGAGIPLLTKDTQESLGLTLKESNQKIEGGGGNAASAFSENNRIILNDSVWLDNVSFAVTDMGAAKSTFQYDGVIGADFMKNFIVKIDFEQQLIELSTANNFTAPPGWQTLSIVNTKGSVPVIQTDFTVNNKIKKLQLLFDCGAAPFSLFLNKRNFTEYASILPPKHNEEIRTGLGGQMKVWSYVNDAIWNNRNWKDLSIGFDVESSTPIIETVDGLLGMELIKRYNVIFNYSKSEIYLQPNNFINESFPVSYSGIQVSAREEKIIVRHVSPGSPGALAGLIPGDEIVAIEGKPAVNLETVRTLLQELGKVLKITIKRNNTLSDHTLKLKRYY